MAEEAESVLTCTDDIRVTRGLAREGEYGPEGWEVEGKWRGSRRKVEGKWRGSGREIGGREGKVGSPT